MRHYETYRERDALLQALGYTSYREYLQGRLWPMVRRQAFTHHGSVCKLCSKRAQVLHHLSYSLAVLLGHDLENLTPLCNKCHDRIEVNAKGQKRSFAEVNRYYRWLLSRQETAKTVAIKKVKKLLRKKSQRMKKPRSR